MKKTLKIVLLIIAAFCLNFALSCGGPPATTSEQSSGQPHNENDEETEMTDTIFFTIENNKIPVKLEQNSATAALVELLKKGDITYFADDYGGFEKVGAPGHSLPRSDRQMTARAGDVVLYSGNQIVLFYGNNSWAYTKLGTIEGYSAEELKTLLAAGKGSIKVTIGLN